MYIYIKRLWIVDKYLSKKINLPLRNLDLVS